MVGAVCVAAQRATLRSVSSRAAGKVPRFPGDPFLPVRTRSVRIPKRGRRGGESGLRGSHRARGGPRRQTGGAGGVWVVWRGQTKVRPRSASGGDGRTAGAPLPARGGNDGRSR